MPTTQQPSDARETDALNAYLRLLEGKGAEPAALQQRKALALHLIPLLMQQPMEGDYYRACVEKVLPGLDHQLRPAFLAVAREYFHFWVGDIKSIAIMNASNGYDISAIAAAVPADDLKAMWASLDQERFGITETWAIKAYASALRGEGADKSVVDTRVKLVKLLLTRLRDVHEKDARSYRAAVDSTSALFGTNETRQLYLIVVREFFYFWTGDPDAGQHILLDKAETG
jgi:hypothetical protein